MASATVAEVAAPQETALALREGKWYVLRFQDPGQMKRFVRTALCEFFEVEQLPVKVLYQGRVIYFASGVERGELRKLVAQLEKEYAS